ncbi:Na+/H+ antiporter NhaA [Novosphingobium sp. TCA1]|uniref:Na+/H+ antiporter NhaA n=1 Tax=Novosphingobium sp. TCA1 TaxID=2682474 RepID=UPI001308F068|nr:Na+/H+ antiporter NhaA [Novosphingobium sp. TCA1]GFE77763.1 Na(+)/H(+) antiporter NhaA [Novosphingobium sp. TCA1]
MSLPPRQSGRIAARAHHSPAAAILRKFEPFFVIGEVSGGPLLIASIAALVLINTAWGSTYAHIWDAPLRLTYDGWAIAKPLSGWINDALMPLFFLIIGTEVKREFVKGSLSSVRTAALPVVGAIGGLVVPVAVYLAFNLGTQAQHGWGTVAAMDTAFSLAIVGMFATSLPPSLRATLLAFAAIDDVFGLLVIAFAYTATLQPWFLALAGAAYLGIILFLRLNWVTPILYVFLGIVVWIGILGSGVHPTIAGVAIGLLLPTNSRLSERRFAAHVQRPIDEIKKAEAAAARADDPDEEDTHHLSAQKNLGYVHEMAAATDEAAARLIRILTPWVSYVVLPLFALSNLRIHFSPDLLSDILHSNLAIGIIAGLAVGKPAGFLFATWLACRLHLARLPEGLTWRMILGIGGVAGIGFTISLFIAELAFTDETLFEEASLGVFAASVLSGLFGYAVFRSVPAKR